ncbi:MAG: hypothetical protein Q9175_003661 [Cornicularia normoerica]
MSSSEPPQKNPQTKETTDSDISDTPGKRSRSQSRRARRRKAQQRTQEKKQHMPSLNEDGEEGEEQSSSPEAGGGAPQPLQHISGDEKSMDGPVTHARAQRGEIPVRGGKPNQEKKGGQSEEMMKQDGLKLRIELNLDIELELKASIRGDITLALLS